MSKKLKKQEDYGDDDCEVCRLTRRGNVTEEELLKAMSLQNFLNNFPKDASKDKEK